VILGATSVAALEPPTSYGPAGTLLGTKLASQGVRTLMLESGRGLAAWLTDRRLRSLAEYDYTGDTNYPLALTTSRILGGNSNFWTGRCEHLHPSDFESHPYTPPRKSLANRLRRPGAVLRCCRAAAAGARRRAYAFRAAAKGAAAGSGLAGHLVSEVFVRPYRRRSGGHGNRNTHEDAADLQRPA
jgi:choline dehydrogenase-like flavoprotein